MAAGGRLRKGSRTERTSAARAVHGGRVRLDPICVLVGSALFGSAAAVCPWPALFSAAALTMAIASATRPRVLLGGLLVLTLGVLRARYALSEFEAERATARDALGGPRRCAGEGVVVTSPIYKRGALVVVVALEGVDCEGRPVPDGLLARLYGGPATMGRGDSLGFVATLAPTSLLRNLDLRDPTPSAARAGVVLTGPTLAVEIGRKGTGVRAIVDRLRAHSRARIEATFPPGAAPLGRALVLGENDLDPEEDAAFRRSGLAHLLAVSGTHLVLAVLSLVAGLRALLVRCYWLAARMDVTRIAAGMGIVAAVVYADYAGGSGSAWRAAWMLVWGLAARVLGRRVPPERLLALSLGVGCCTDPLLAFDVSWLLSAAATAGLLLLGRPLSRRCAPLPTALRYVANAVAATVSAMLPCAPLLALLTPELTFASILANVVAAPFGEAIALPFCLVHGCLSFLPPLERGVSLVASGSLLVVRQIALLSAETRFLAFRVPEPTGWQLGVLALGAVELAVTLRWRQEHPRTGPRALAAALWLPRAGFLGAGLLALELAQIHAGTPYGLLRVTALDVGQGDAILVDLPDGKLMLIDGGGAVGSPFDPGRLVVIPVLRARRRDRIDIVVLTHPHPDHLGGLPSVLSQVEVGEFWDSGLPHPTRRAPPDSTAATLQALVRERGILRRTPSELCFGARHYGEATVELLGPCPRARPDLGTNDNSIVLRIRYGRTAAVLAGDVEAAGERQLMSSAHELGAELLKVGHHGSRTSSTAPFLTRVHPRYAVVSCGVRNPHGHPHQSTIDRLLTSGAEPLRTDRGGSIQWVSDGARSSVLTFRPP